MHYKQYEKEPVVFLPLNQFNSIHKLKFCHLFTHPLKHGIRCKPIKKTCIWIFCGLLPVLMNNSIEQSSIPPRGSEVVTADTYIAFSHLLGPQQKPLLGCHVLGLSCHMDVRDLQAGKMTFLLILLRTCVIT